MKRFFLFFVAVLLITSISSAQYQLVWEENFDGTEINTDYWNVENNVGIWNTGSNQELQHYRSENVEVGPDGDGNNVLILTAKRENYNGFEFTSGRINSKNKVAARYGKMEARIKLPVLENGLWPAFWMLGSQGGTWPANGEIDIMEAGNQEGISRDLQDRWYNGALHWDNFGSYAMYSDDGATPTGVSLYDYNTFTLVWTPESIDMYLNDLTQPYFSMDITGADAEEFRDWTHFFILNLAVGGSFPGITNATSITAPFPAQMFVDYVRVYQIPGEGEIEFNQTPVVEESDYYGIFTERASVTNKFVINDFDTHLYIWNNLEVISGQLPYEGNELLAFSSPGAAWCGFGLFSDNGVDVSAFANGYLNFSVNIPQGSQDVFDIIMEDKDGGEAVINFGPNADPAGVARDGDWDFVSIPLTELTAQGVDLSNLGNVFAVSSDNPTEGFIFDDVFLSRTPTTINKVDSNKAFRIYPNPASEYFLLAFEKDVAALSVFDSSGRTVFGHNDLQRNNKLNVNCSSWNKGFHIVLVKYKDGHQDVGNLMIQ